MEIENIMEFRGLSDSETLYNSVSRPSAINRKPGFLSGIFTKDSLVKNQGCRNTKLSVNFSLYSSQWWKTYSSVDAQIMHGLQKYSKKAFQALGK